MSMNVTVRSATLSDLPAITAIYEDEVLNGTATYELTAPNEAEMTRRFEGLASAGYPYLVAAGDDGAILGYAYAGPFRTRPAYNWFVEDSIYLAREARGQGVGTRLLAELLTQSDAKGFRQMLAVIGGAENAGSIRLHAKAGFEMIGTMKATGLKFGRWVDTVLMQRPLGDGATTIPNADVFPGPIGR